MLIDLEDIRPQNESYEHFILKQVGRCFLSNQNIRCIGTEVEFVGHDQSPFGSKRVVDVLGIDRRVRTDTEARKLYNKIKEVALQIGMAEGITETYGVGRIDFKNYHILTGTERTALEYSINNCFERACISLHLPKDLYKSVEFSFKEDWAIRSIESKVSISDFRNGFSVAAEFAYIIAPVGVIPKNELPQKVGLLEFDFDVYHKTRKWQEALKVTKKPKKEYDSMFFVDGRNKKGFNKEYYNKVCRELLFRIAQQNTEELIYWNPFVKNIKEGENLWFPETFYKYKIGDITPKGIVVDRRIGKNPDKSKQRSYDYNKRYIDFYKLVVPNQGIMKKWIPSNEIE